MKTLGRDQAAKLWDQYWAQTEKEWFKVEVLQDYSGEDEGESLKSWKIGNRQRSIQLMEQQQNGWVKIARTSPANKIRLHIINKPLTAYVEWEIEVYKRVNIPKAGEKVYLVDYKDVGNLALPDGDFMILDNQRVVRNYYDASGKMHKADFYDEREDISMF